MSRNEARSLEDLDPIEGLDQMLQPLNMQAAPDSPQESAQSEGLPEMSSQAAELWTEQGGTRASVTLARKDLPANEEETEQQ